jgi:outer membrane protein assembly factor BamA
MSGAPPVAAMQAMESSEEQFIAVGGYRSLRGYYDGRFTGPGKLLTSLEARYGLIWAPSLFEVNLVAFYDAARVFGPGETVKVTASGLHRAGGGEVAVRLLRTTLLVLGYGHGPEGGQFLFGTTWSF